MLKKITGLIFVLAMALLVRTNTAHAALTVGANSVTSDGVLTLQGTSVAITGDTTFANKVAIGGAIDANSFLYIAPPEQAFSTTTFGINATLSQSSNNQLIGLFANAKSTATSGTTFATYGGNANATNSGVGSTMSNLVGFQGQATSLASTTTTSMYGARGFTANLGTATNNIGVYADVETVGGSAVTTSSSVIRGTVFNTGTTTTLKGLDFSGWAGGGTVGTSYGIYMDTSIDRGSTKYAIYSLSASASYLQGNLGIGTSSATAKLDINGHLAFTQSAGAPTPNVTGAGYSSASLGAGSTDGKGTITATVGAAAGTLLVTFQTGYASAPVCTVTPGTATAQVDSGKMYATTSTSALTLNFVATPTGGSETWSYICVQ